MKNLLYNAVIGILLITLASSCGETPPEQVISLKKGDRIALIGNNLCSRMMNYNHFETAVQMSFPDHELVIRNMCDGGDTPGFRPHSGRDSSWAFPGAKEYQTEFANPSFNRGHFEFPDEWMTRLKINKVIAFFGYPESFHGEEGLYNFKRDLQGFIDHTKAQKYNGTDSVELAIISPIAFEDLSNTYDLPDGKIQNENLQKYTESMKFLAEKNGVKFVDVFTPSTEWFSNADEWTVDGFQMTDKAYEHFSEYLSFQLFGKNKKNSSIQKDVKEAVEDKNWYWHNDYKIPNGVHVFGRRYDPFGPDNYPFELKKIRELTEIRDRNIWATLQGQPLDLLAEDKNTSPLPDVTSNYQPGDYGRGEATYLYGNDAVNEIQVPEGYKIELFASEKEFPDLANPSQLSFDNEGRLWVSTMPSYPHYKPGDKKPNDKLIILEDTDGDGKADNQITAADGKHLPIGFELSPEGVYISQGTNLKLLTDADGDDYYEGEEILLSGFDDHDTHHAISAFCADPSGAIYMGEGVFLHTNVETAYGTVRAHNGGFYRYNPQKRHLERTAQLSIPNPWGIAFDEWGQPFFLETSGPAMRWMTPGTIHPFYGSFNHKSIDLVKEEDRVRPTSGLEFISSRHFPDDVQGDVILNNSIGFLGTRQLSLKDKGTGYEADFKVDLTKSTDPNFRPVDMEFAPDGSLYIVDWHNVLIGHMQHNARDPYRDHAHGRIYRVTYPSRPLIQPAKIVNASISELLDNLKLPEYRTRYRTRRELAGRNHKDVLAAIGQWTSDLDKNGDNYEKYLLEALWITWRLNKIDQDLLETLLSADNYKVRTAAVKVLRYNTDKVSDYHQLMMSAASDPNSRVRLEAMVAASWLPKKEATDIMAEVSKMEMDEWIAPVHANILSHLSGEVHKVKKKGEGEKSKLKGAVLAQYIKGKEIYEREAHCETCHQSNGKGLKATGYPPLAGTEWVTGNQERLIKITLNGLHGPIKVLGIEYPGQVPMTAFGGLLDDDELAAVLTYVRNSFGNEADPVKASYVKEIRAKTAGKDGFYVPKELLSVHPMNGFSK